MKTEKTKVDGHMYVFAVPKPTYELEALEPEDLPYTYTMRSFDYAGDDDAVAVHDFPVSGEVPAGIDIVMKAIEGLRERIKTVESEAAAEVIVLEKKIKALALIEYKPEETEDGI